MTKEDSDDFLDFWTHEYLPIIRKNDHFLNITISRLNDYRRRPNWSYGLIDLTTSLESLYQGPGEKTELAYRLSHRCATLLGFAQTGSEKEKIRKYIKTAYDLRSSMVHGGRPEWRKLEKVDPDLRSYDFVEEIFEYTRKSIRKFLEINRDLNLAGGERRQKQEV